MTFKELRESRKGITIWYLTTVEFVGTRRNLYRFTCKCGKEVVASWQRVVRGDVKSCGCWKKGRPVSDDPYVPHRTVYHRYRLGAKHRNLAFELSEQEVFDLVVQDCSYCGLSPSTDMKLSAHPNFRYTGIDRVDNDRGYEKDNVVPCCETCNNSKRTLSLEEWKSWITRLYNRMNHD